MKTIVVDPSKCIQCCNCQIACKDEFVDNEWMPYAKQQAEGQFWIQIREKEVASGRRMKLNRVPVPCQQCKDAPCMKVAKDDAVYRREDGIVMIDPVKAKGQKAIMDACPYDAVYWNDALDIPQKCTGCAHLMDLGWDAPRCVTACPTDALSFVDESELNEVDWYAPIETLHPEYGTQPRVAYVNLPKPFIAGNVFDPALDECLNRAKVVATHEVTGKAFEGETDYLGEFKLEGLDPGFYSLAVDHEDYVPRTIAHLDVREAINVGDLGIYKVPA